MAGPRVAVVGAGAWGTTLARLIAGAEPVTLVCHSVAVAEEISRTHRNEITIARDRAAGASPRFS